MESSPRQTEQQRQYGGFPGRPLVWSLLLHGVVLAALTPQLLAERPQASRASPLQGVLVAHPAMPMPIKSQPLPPQPVITRPARSQKPLTTETTAVAAVLPASTFAPPAVSEPAGVMVAPAPERVATAVVAEPRETGVDAAGLRQYRLALAGELKRHRRYPETARRAGWMGTSEVRVAIDAAGAAPRAELNRSSGHAVLDEAAMQMLRLAAPRIELPDSLRGRSFAVLLPVVFEIED